ncbi:MAG: HAMP domain-containing protein [Firmicutes bacterium]|nr:HAMP domain-containing protein [Bacillota bacterium]
MRTARAWALIRSLPDIVSVRLKIMGIVLCLVLLIGAGVTIHMRYALMVGLANQLEQRAISITRDVAARSAEPILTNNVVALYELLRDTLENNDDIRYVFILDPSGEPMAHTFPNHLPAGLAEANRAGDRDRYRLELLDTEEGVVRDVAVPILDGTAGFARVGMLERSVQKAVASATYKLLFFVALVSVAGLLAGYLLSGILARPLTELVEVTKAVAKGDLDIRATVWAQDEIGELSGAFNAMVTSLAGLYREKEEFNKLLLEKERLLTHLLRKVISAQEEERKRIARELHDEAGQSLTSLMIGLRLLESSPDPGETKARVAGLRQALVDVLEDIRRLAIELRPSVLDDLGLVAALERYVADYAKRYTIEADLHVRGFEAQRLPQELETALYRIIQEALTNVARHASARNVSVLVEHKGDMVEAIVEDDGVGFDVNALTLEGSWSQKLGVFGMQERANLVGGSLTIESDPGSGTTVFVKVPAGTRPAALSPNGGLAHADVAASGG